MNTEHLTTLTEAAAEMRDGWRRLHERLESGDITLADLRREVEQASYAAEEMWRALASMRDAFHRATLAEAVTIATALGPETVRRMLRDGVI